MKLYNLLILSKNTKMSKNNFKAPKKSVIVIFSFRILPCEQNKSAIYSTLHHMIIPTSWTVRLNAVGTFNRPLGSV